MPDHDPFSRTSRGTWVCARCQFEVDEEPPSCGRCESIRYLFGDNGELVMEWIVGVVRSVVAQHQKDATAHTGVAP